VTLAKMAVFGEKDLRWDRRFSFAAGPDRGVGAARLRAEPRCGAHQREPRSRRRASGGRGQRPRAAEERGAEPRPIARCSARRGPSRTEPSNRSGSTPSWRRSAAIWARTDPAWPGPSTSAGSDTACPHRRAAR